MKKIDKKTKNEITNLVKESVKSIFENKYKKHDYRMKVAQHIAGKTPEEKKAEWDDIMAKRTAITDINRDRNIMGLPSDEREFMSAVTHNTFNTDFRDLVDTYDESITPISITEAELKEMISSAVNKILKEEHWPGDINPRVMQGFQQDSINSQLEKCNQRIDKCVEELRNYAKAGHLNQVENCTEIITTCAKLIHRFKTEKL